MEGHLDTNFTLTLHQSLVVFCVGPGSGSTKDKVGLSPGFNP